MPQGANTQPEQRDVEQELERRRRLDHARDGGPEYSSTIASCTIVSSRWVAGLSTGIAGVLGDRDHDQRDQREAERDAQADVARRA